MEFRERLALERKRLGFTQTEFAEKCGVSDQTQSLYERGKGWPNAEYLMKACDLGVDPLFLLMNTMTPAEARRMSEEEKAPLVAFQGMSPKARKAMMALVEAVKDEG